MVGRKAGGVALFLRPEVLLWAYGCFLRSASKRPDKRPKAMQMLTFCSRGSIEPPNTPSSSVPCGGEYRYLNLIPSRCSCSAVAQSCG